MGAFGKQRTPAPAPTKVSKGDYAAAKAALLTKIAPFYAKLSDPQDRVAFVLAMTGPRGPKLPGAGLQYGDFMSAGDFNEYATLANFDSSTNTFGGNPRGPEAMPVSQFYALVAQADAA